jgi:hypothetical protein
MRRTLATSRAAVQSRPGDPAIATSSRICLIESKSAASANEGQPLPINLAIDPMLIHAPVGFRQDPDFLNSSG